MDKVLLAVSDVIRGAAGPIVVSDIISAVCSKIGGFETDELYRAIDKLVESGEILLVDKIGPHGQHERYEAVRPAEDPESDYEQLSARIRAADQQALWILNAVGLSPERQYEELKKVRRYLSGWLGPYRENQNEAKDFGDTRSRLAIAEARIEAARRLLSDIIDDVDNGWDARPVDLRTEVERLTKEREELFCTSADCVKSLESLLSRFIPGTYEDSYSVIDFLRTWIEKMEENIADHQSKE